MPRHFALVLGLGFLAVAEGECWMWVCPACVHTPKTSWPLPFAPFLSLVLSTICLGFGYKAFAAPCYLLHAHVKLRSDTWGAWSMRPRPPSSSQPSFWEVGKGRLTRTPPGVLGRPCPPIPLHRTLKEGHGGGWGGMWNAELRGSAGGAKAPHRVDPRNGN